MSGSIFEAMMMVCFGVSWPLSIYKTYKVKNPAGKSIAFLWCVIAGYLSGIVSKIVTGNVDWVIALYALNAAMVATDLFLVCLYRARQKAAKDPRK